MAQNLVAASSALLDAYLGEHDTLRSEIAWRTDYQVWLGRPFGRSRGERHQAPFALRGPPPTRALLR
jgi:hypothetical protein